MTSKRRVIYFDFARTLVDRRPHHQVKNALSTIGRKTQRDVRFEDDSGGPLKQFSVRKIAVVTAAQARVTRGDPQSGPPSPSRVPGFFHYNLQWVYAEEGRILGLSKSRYINREEEREDDRLIQPAGIELERDVRGEGLSAYINRGADEANPELGHHLLITRGLRVRDGAGLARRLDACERKKDRTYRQYGGRMPRVACHAIISFNWGISESDAVSALTEHAHLLSDTLRVPLEGRIHVEHGRPDHAHLLIGTRVVEDGKIGSKQRQLDAVSDKADGRGIVIDGRVLGSTLEMLRADWAERMRRASGDQAIDHRSYQRRGVALYPVTHVRRGEILYQSRHSRATWREQRAREMALRFDLAPATNDGVEPVAAGVDVASTGIPARRDMADPRPVQDAGRSPPRAVPQGRRPPDPAVPDLAPPKVETTDSGEERSGGDAVPAPAHVRQDAASPHMMACAGAHAELKCQHRLSEAREQHLAAFAGVDVTVLRRASEEARPKADRSVGATAQARPMALAAVLAAWKHDDRQARAARRKDGGRVSGVETAPAPASGPGGGALASPGPHAADQSASAPPPRAARPRAHPPEPVRTSPDVGVAPAVAAHAGPAAAAASDVLARALFQAHADDVLLRAYDAGRPPPSEVTVLDAVARRLRASGSDRDEVARCLCAGVTPARPDDVTQIEPAVARAFSDRTTAWLETAPLYREHATRVSDRAERAAWRSLRNDALAQLKRDLDEVWATRRADVEAVMVRHRRAVAFIRDMQWSGRRLQHRGTILAILSILIELAVLKPLLALERHMTEQERRDLNEAAAEASAALKARRDEWKAAIGVPQSEAAQDLAGGTGRDRETSVSRESEASESWKVASGRARAGAPAPRPAVRAAKGVRKAVSDSPRRRGKMISSLEIRRLRSELQTPRTKEDANDKAVNLFAAIRAESDPAKRRLMMYDLRRSLSHPQMSARAREPGAVPVAPVEPKAVDTARLETCSITTNEPNDIVRQRGARPTSVVSAAPTDGRRGRNGRAPPAAPDLECAAPRAGHIPSDRESSAPSARETTTPLTNDGVPTQTASGEPPRDDIVADRETEVRRLAVDYAVVVAASGRWPTKYLPRLAALAGLTTGQLWAAAGRRSAELTQSRDPRHVSRQQLTDINRQVWNAARQAGDQHLLRAMHAIATGRGGRDDPDGVGGR